MQRQILTLKLQVEREAKLKLQEQNKLVENVHAVLDKYFLHTQHRVMLRVFSQLLGLKDPLPAAEDPAVTLSAADLESNAGAGAGAGAAAAPDAAHVRASGGPIPMPRFADGLTGQGVIDGLKHVIEDLTQTLSGLVQLRPQAQPQPPSDGSDSEP